MVMQSKINYTKDVMKRKANEIDKSKLEKSRGEKGGYIPLQPMGSGRIENSFSEMGISDGGSGFGSGSVFGLNTTAVDSFSTKSKAVLATDGLLKDIESITQKYKTLTMAHRGEVKAIVTTVIPLPVEEQKELKETLQYILGAGKKVLIEQKVKELKKKLKNEKSQAHIDENVQTAENEAAIAELRCEMDEARAERL